MLTLFLVGSGGGGGGGGRGGGEGGGGHLPKMAGGLAQIISEVSDGFVLFIKAS